MKAGDKIMNIKSIKFYEGDNIKFVSRVVKVEVTCSTRSEKLKYIKEYIKINFILGFLEKVIDLVNESSEDEIWLTYSEEDVSKFILEKLADNYEEDIIIKKAKALKEYGLINNIAKFVRQKDMPVIRLSKKCYQLGYGKNALIISNNYQSYEKNHKVEIIKDKKTLFEILRYNHIPKVAVSIVYGEKNIEISRVGTFNFRVFCFNGEIKLVYKIEIHENSSSDTVRKVIYSSMEGTQQINDLCKEVYNCFQISLLCIDLAVKDEEIMVWDVNSIFQVQEEITPVENQVIECIFNCYKKMGMDSIPIISVTGTNGKTTTVRLINYIMNELGYNTAMTSTAGIFIGNVKLKNGDTTGFLSARDVLTNLQSEAAVLETARGGILRNGLGYEKASVGVITSVSEDHIGKMGIKDLNDLANTKSVILHDVNTNGRIIVKAQSEIMKVVSEVRKINNSKRLCVFSLDKNKYIEQAIENNDEAIYLKNEDIIYYNHGIEKSIAKVNEIPFTQNGHSRSNILNIMAAMGAVLDFTNGGEKIMDVIGKIKCDLYFNPGRQNIIDVDNYKIILDYGHNSEAFYEVFNIAKALKPAKITSIITAPGDRLDKYIIELGTIAAEYSDNIIVREQEDLRGRNVGETANLLIKGVLNSGFSNKNIKLIYKEQEAIVEAMMMAQAGEVIILFTQCLDVVIPAINCYLKSIGRELIGKDIDFSH
ncbi:MAG: mur ligase middle domain protein [Clostridiaceae bacterium]|jgi:UDP-N-acetylmuramyl tripeptide synthase|nr:mur ligase middle domain protein [Clostridiaceae bacterium]